MRRFTYILGAIAGFFTFGGIGLIYKGYQVEGGIFFKADTHYKK